MGSKHAVKQAHKDRRRERRAWRPIIGIREGRCMRAEILVMPTFEWSLEVFTAQSTIKLCPHGSIPGLSRSRSVDRSGAYRLNSLFFSLKGSRGVWRPGSRRIIDSVDNMLRSALHSSRHSRHVPALEFVLPHSRPSPQDQHCTSTPSSCGRGIRGI